MSFIATLDNRTRFTALHCPLPDGQGGEVVLVVVKAGFTIAADGSATPLDDAVEIRMTDELRGDPKRGSPLWDADLAVFKPRVDVLVEGLAHAPRERPAEQCFVELHVADEIAKSVLVSGDRIWEGDQPSRPAPFLTIPLSWERAYGGTRSRELADERNPVGIGYHGARSADPEVHSELPNLEDPGAALVRPDTISAPVGFGTVGRAWLPRRALAGTFDDGWKRRRWPLAPRDFDPAYHQSAPADQQLSRYVGGAPVRLVNLTAEGEWLFRLPSFEVPVHLVYEDRLAQPELRVDTVEIEPELRRVVLTGRVAIVVEPRRGPLEEIILGEVAPAWLAARRTGKRHVELRTAKTT
jgi:hypothetical protein